MNFAVSWSNVILRLDEKDTLKYSEWETALQPEVIKNESDI